MNDLLVRIGDPVAALARLVPRLTQVAERHGFVHEAAGRDWAHWVSRRDEKVVIRAYAFASDGGGISVTMSGATMSADVERDVMEAIGDL